MANVFLVESLLATTHTFIRSDIADSSKSKQPVVIDIGNPKWLRFSKFSEWISTLLSFLWIAISQAPDVVRLLACSRRKSNFKALVISARLFKQFAQMEPRTISAHFLGKAATIGTIVARANRHRLRIVCHASDLYTLPKMMEFILRKANVIETVTWFGKGFVYGRLGDDALDKVVMRRNRVVLPATDTPRSQPVKNGSLLLVTIARIVPQKDLGFAIDVIAEINRLGMEAHFHIAGIGPLESELREQVLRKNLQDRVKFLGEVTNAQALEILSASDGLLLPCAEKNLDEADGLPVAFQETLLLGRPVFCRDAFGVAELIINGVNGWTFGKDSEPEEWARTIAANVEKYDSSTIRSIANAQCC
jgi:glycosyltransferase involved in cell wall biosynthesis